MAKGFNLKAIFSADTKDIESGATRATNSVKQFDRDSKKALDSFVGGTKVAGAKAKSFGNNIGALAARFAAAAVSIRSFASAVKTIASFEAANSKLAAVLGTTIKGVERLTQSAIELGRQTQYTASEVTELQTELAKLGFSEPEIISMQEGVLKFAAAVGTDLASAAARAGATMRGFGLTADETAEMLATMAVSTSKSALSFGYLDETLGKVVPVTKAFGLDTKATVSLLGAMANAGIDASSAGTALRRIMAELSNAGSKLNKELGSQPKTMEDVIAALKQLRDNGIGVTEAFDLVGKYSGATFLALVNGADDCETLYNELQDVDGALNDMYETMTDNVEGAVKQLESAWEGFILSMRQSRGVIKTTILLLRDAVSEANRLLFKGTRDAEAKSKYASILGGIFSREGMDGVKKFVEDEINELNSVIEGKNRKKTRSILAGPLGAWSLANAQADINQYKSMLQGLQEAYASLQEQALRTGDTLTTTTASTDSGGGNAGGSGDGGGGKKGTKGTSQLTKEAQEYAAAAKEVMEADAEMDAVAARLLAKYEETHPVIDEATQSLIALANQTAHLVELGQKYNGALGDIQGHLSDINHESIRLAITLEEEVSEAVEEAQREWAENFDKMQRRTKEFSDGIRSMLSGAFEDTFVNLGTFIGDALTGGEDAMTDFSSAMLSTFGDMCIQLGELIITASGALEAIQAALEFSENPWVAAAAGAALIAVGAAVKAGAANLARGGGYSSSSVSSSYGSSMRSNDYVTRDFTVNVTGTLVANGSQLVAVLNNENKRKNLTT